jgi:hypothetical protein
VERKTTPLWMTVPNKTWEGNLPLIRGYTKEVAVIHCQGNQRYLTLVQRENNLAEQKAKQAALQPLGASWGLCPGTLSATGAYIFQIHS